MRAAAIIQEDFALGEVRDVAPHLIPNNGAYQMTNILLEEDGSPFRRGGTEYHSDAAFGATGLRWIWEGYFPAGLRTVFANESDFGVLDSDDESPLNLGSDGLSTPRSAAQVAGLLFIAPGFIYGGSRKTANYNTGTVTVTNGSTVVTGAGTTWNTLVDNGMLFQRGNERVYAIESVDSVTQITLSEPYEGVNGAGLAYTLTPLYKITASDPYEASSFYATVAGRLLVGSGNYIRFSEIGAPHDFTVTIGGVSVENRYQMPEGARLLGAAEANGTALIFTTQGIWALDNLPYDIVDVAGNALQRLRRVSGLRLLGNGSGIARWEQALVVPCVDGVWLMDGLSEPRKVSQSIDPDYRRDVALGYVPGGAAVYRDHYLLPILTTAGAVKRQRVCRLDRPVERRGQVVYPWSRFEGCEITAFTQRVTDDSTIPRLLAADAKTTSRVLDCSAFFDPDAAHKADADGVVPTFDLITRDYATGNQTLNVVKHVRPRYELVDAASDNPELDISYSTGQADPTQPYWGAPGGAWGTGFGPSGTAPWTESTSGSFNTVGSLGEDPDGTHPQRLRVGKRTRHIRFRLRCDDPAAAMRLRSLELFTRQSNAPRR